MKIQCWEMRNAGEPLVRASRTVDRVAPDEVLVRVAGCGICHTDLGYLHDGVRTRHPLPLVLGHEISGTVIDAGADVAEWMGRSVIVPAVIPCQDCRLCQRGRSSICRGQIFPGCDVDGGFASHVVVPARGLCSVDDDELARSGVELCDLAVLADAVATPYHAILRSGLAEGDVAIFVGVGGVGGFGVQIANALGAHVLAIDVDAGRLTRLTGFGAAHTIEVGDLGPKEIRTRVRAYVDERRLPDTCWKIFETSGTAGGQETAFSLLTFGAHLSLVGYANTRVPVRLSNLMAFDATAQGCWGCPPEHYPGVLDLVLAGDVALAPFVQRRTMGQINDTLADLRAGRLSLRPILIPDFEREPLAR
jgi:6-hydroxycyclohex-1-ene-1-carbonyl-CoA dehydrogenase